MDQLWDVILDALLDCAKLTPFLLVTIFLMEYLEHRAADRMLSAVRRAGRFGPLLGGLVGCIPQCGFSTACAQLFNGGFVSAGTLVAVFLATSDEAPILLLTDITNGAKAAAIMPLIAVKFAVAVGAGYLANAVCRRERLEEPQGEEVHGAPCGHDHEHDSPVRQYLVHPLLHSLEIFAYLLAVNILFGIAMYYAEDSINSFLQAKLWWQPLIAAAVGLIPNCASSVLVTQAYIDGFITFGACAAGLCVNAGLGVVVLLRNVRAWRRNLALWGVLFAIGAAAGYAVQAIGLLF